jgi:hypothetical protein
MTNPGHHGGESIAARHDKQQVGRAVPSPPPLGHGTSLNWEVKTKLNGLP